MSHRARLTPLDWSALERMRAQAHAAQYAPAVLSTLAGTVQPFFSPEESRTLSAAEATQAPFGALAGLRLRSDPVQYAGPVGKWLTDHAPNLLDDMLVELAVAGPTVPIAIETDLFLAFYSPAYRWYFVGMGDPAAAVVFDGPPVILASLGGRLPPEPADITLYSADKVREHGAALTALGEDFDTIGDLRYLYEFCDDFVAPNFPLQELCRYSLQQLRDIYDDGAARNLGLRILT